ncbi:MAG: hypothetical protein PHE53_06890 [Thermoguttaceae bacterium]|nr:hypothetical protein [Thermoguttaceae bacterium]
MMICWPVMILAFCTLLIAQDLPSSQRAIQAIQDGQAMPAGSDSQLQIYAPPILEVKGRFEYDGDGAVIGLDLASERTSVSDAILPSILYFTELRKLRVSGNLSPGAIDQLLRLSKLTELFLQDTSMDDETFVHLSRLPNLTSLGVRRAAKLTDTALKPMEKFTTLTSLSLIDLNLSDAACAEIAKVNTLKMVDLRGCSRVGTEGIRHLAAIPSLKAIRLKGTAIDDKAASELAQFPALKNITLEECGVTVRGMEDIAKLNPEEIVLFRCISVNDSTLIPILISSNQLKRLTVRDCILKGETLSRCVSKDRLVDLRLSETWLDDSSAEFLAECIHLKRLELRATRVTDAALEKIATLEELEYLHLQGTQITDAGLAKLAACSSLRYLNIAQTAVSEGAAQEFQQTHPQCEIDRRITY